VSSAGAPAGVTWPGTALRILALFGLLYGFLVAIESMSKAIQALADTGMLGGDETEVFSGVHNPFAGLALGILFTVMVQSSSTTTSTIVAVVGSGVLPIEHAVPMIMGANIGTTITNTLVSIGHIRRRVEFRRAFAAATVHDFFNLLCVVVLFPLELATGFLAGAANWLADNLSIQGGSYKSPIKTAVKAGHKAIQSLVESLGAEGGVLGWVMLAVGLAITFLCLSQITRLMKRLLAGRIESAIHRALGGNPLLGMGVGAAITVSVQSSSITTSLMVPLCAAGVMTLELVFPLMLGANIGTTVTAMIASLSQEGSAALAIALVHLLFNLLGVAIVYPFPAVRRIPLVLARALAFAAIRNRLWVLAYVFGAFVVLPLSGWLLWRHA
jgi:sodium-dependent phosphate cotransporter